MQKLSLQTPDITSENIEKIKALFPEVITEREGDNGNIIEGIDFELLQQKLSTDIVDGSDERYRLDWPGKKRSILKANTPINKTLVPDRESSVDFEHTENIYIEGDNFEVLKILQESYLNKIKMIYIDPPYNTGKDFVYKDNFKVSREEYEEELGVTDEEGGRLFKNTDTNGRFHSDWLSMMYERLVIARDLLKDDGVIFISIDDNEVHNLRKICDEIFGEQNFINKFIWINKPEGRQTQKKGAAGTHEFIYCYSKNIEYINEFLLPAGYLSSIMPKTYGSMTREIKTDDRGEYIITHELHNGNSVFNEETRPTLVFDIYYNKDNGDIKIESMSEENKHPTYVKIKPHKNNDGVHKYNAYRWGKEKILSESYNLEFVESGNTFKIFTKRRDFENVVIKDLITGLTTKNGTVDLSTLGLIGFDFPKPVDLIKFFSKTITSDIDIIIDFFSGSATTAHAVMQLNAEDGGNRKFIMVQIPEQTDEKSEAYKAGYKTIPEIGRERIRRAGKKIVEENAEKLAERETPLDTGFRAYKVADTIYNDVFVHPENLQQSMLDGLADNIKSDKSPEDILTAVMLSLGLTLDLPIKSEKVGAYTVFTVADGALVACFDMDIDMSLVETIAKQKPLRAVFRDASFKNDQDRINTETTFKQLSPETRVSVI